MSFAAKSSPFSWSPCGLGFPRRLTAVSFYTQRSFDSHDTQRSEALVAQFNKEFAQRAKSSPAVENIHQLPMLRAHGSRSGAPQRPTASLYVTTPTGAPRSTA